MFFNSLLQQYGISPTEVILLRHQDTSATRGRTLYALWRDDSAAFQLYQSRQTVENRSKFSRAPFWASFVVTPTGATMFVGLYAATYDCLLIEDSPMLHRDGMDLAGTCDRYELILQASLCDLQGRLCIEWGDGTRAWVQRADKQNKPVHELRASFKEPEFPGFLNFIEPLSKIAALPVTWVAVLKQATGVYLLTCPSTKEQYVGSAYGEEGFWHRWKEYFTTGHGGNVALKSRNYSDYQVAVLEVAGSAAKVEDILAMESRWKKKLQSREMGLNRN